MEISKGLQEEIILVQNKLKNAIRDHQICVGKLKDDPNNTDILSQIQEIQLHIVSLGRCQKQVVERLRKEVELYKADNANGVKVSLAGLLGLNNNNHITTNNSEAKRDEVKVHTNGIEVRNNYEECYRNGSVNSQRNLCAKDRSSSVETISAEDDDDDDEEEDVIEVSNDENSTEKQSESSEIEVPQVDEYKSEVKQVNFLSNLGLITASQLDELQNKKAERKRRSTANPQFVYSGWDLPTKCKRHCYLQSAGSAPQTRQTTARLNGPSPPPPAVKPPVPRPKSTSPPNKVAATTKSLIPQQKPVVRPNILRTMQETRTFQSRGKLEGGREVGVGGGKPVDSKAVHIPGLPASLTIERIENDTAVCINCRNPGTLTICETCSSNYHTSCHTVSPPPPRQCPKCVQRKKEEDRTTPVIKKDEELEEKERERDEQRERNSNLRLQVYELEKRSQLLGQSLQLQHRMRQELLGKQEKTQKSIKRMVDFIKLMQQSPNEAKLSQDQVTSASCQRPHSSSPLLKAPSPTVAVTNCQQLHKISSLSPPTSPTHRSESTPSPTSTRASPTSNPSPGIIHHTSSSNTSSSRSSHHPKISRSYQRIAPKPSLEPMMTHPQRKITVISPNHHHCSTTSSPEAPRSPYPVSIQSYQSWNHQKPNQDHQQSSTNPPTNQLTNSTINPAHQSLPYQRIQTQVIYTTQCSQSITAPIPSPVVLISQREVTSEKTQSLIDSPDDSPRIEQQRIIDLDSPPPSSPNT